MFRDWEISDDGTDFCMIVRARSAREAAERLVLDEGNDSDGDVITVYVKDSDRVRRFDVEIEVDITATAFEV